MSANNPAACGASGAAAPQLGRLTRGLRIGLRGLLAAVILMGLSACAVLGEEPEPLDLVLENGRVIDPDTGLDARRHVGIRDGRIVAISTRPLPARDTVDVSGLVVAPGFIDLHAHGQSNAANDYQARDGVTTALELEVGKPHLRDWLASRQGRALLNYGASVGHGHERWPVMAGYRQFASPGGQANERGPGETGEAGVDEALIRSARYESQTPEETAAMLERLKAGLAAGGLGIGLPVGYHPGATTEEIYRVYAFAAEQDVPVFTHIRDFTLAALQEALANAALTGAALHICHIHSTALANIGVTLEMLDAARARGVDVSTEVYPYTAGSTSLESSLFDPGWQQRMGGLDYGDLQWVATGERLTPTSFERYREQGGTVIVHMMRPEWVARAMASPHAMIASDGMPYAPGAHPRSAGTFARVLGRHVREEQQLSLMEALAKMTIQPARRLERVAPGMRAKGRLQPGADADITVFDPARVIDTATFESGLSHSRGIEHVLVNGQFVVRGGQSVPNVFPGKAILGKYRR